ncbi:MAG TPA: AAA domain-containing protein [Candidatus Limnocylindria bacterium]|nr:AAA domain-containing protein [Candidatus Limnocylindria bacterium]
MTILRTMLQRLYANLAAGPGLQARPHNSRQRIDLMDLRLLRSGDPSSAIATLLANPEKSLDFAVSEAAFEAAESAEAKAKELPTKARARQDPRAKLLTKLRDIAEDAVDYYNDHGEQSLFIGFPLLSLPASSDRQSGKSQRVLAPVLFIPVSLRVRRGSGAGVSLQLVGNGAELVQPNLALMAWLEHQSGTSTEGIFADETGEEPWREIADALGTVVKAVGIKEPMTFTAETRLSPAPRTEELPDKPALLPCAVMGLFPLANPGLLRDTKWMIETEPDLQNPVKPFLAPEAVVERLDEPTPQAQEFDPTEAGPSNTKDFAEELLVTHADPCQAEAVAQARSSAALVIHGPPGTGKSQTIANIIGDHLARGERVLFVCDKRTALDVVKYRLDSMGLGGLCGVIHDPQRDRRDFYLALRERLENLAQEPPVASPQTNLAEVNTRLNGLHAELRGYFDRLHSASPTEASFHQLCGEWLGLQGCGPVEVPDIDGLTIEVVRAYRMDAEEVVRRAVKARWPENPFVGRLSMPLKTWLETPPGKVRASLDKASAAAQAVDALAGEDLIPLDAAIPLVEQAAARRKVADQLESVVRRSLPDFAARLAMDRNWRRWVGELSHLRGERERLDLALERELVLQVKGNEPNLQLCNANLLALESWGALTASFKRFFAFAAKKAATAAVSPLALRLDSAGLERARAFYAGLRSRYLWSDLRDRVLGIDSAGLASDDLLLSFRDGLPEILAVLESLLLPVNEAIMPSTLDALASLPAAPGVVASLRRSANRAEAILRLEQELTLTQLFDAPAIQSLSKPWRTNQAAEPICRQFIDYSPTLDEAIRLLDRLGMVPAPIQQALAAITQHGLPWEEAGPALRASALAKEIRRRVREDDTLSRLDTARVEAAFSELLNRTGEKTALVRQLILHTWQARWRSRLLATTGSRLNGLGAALRQRLFVRGQKAMKLRQMIAAGADSEGGDPLFELCPVWMASPATVAQIFPRQALFDVVIFDEASQCRLEEALPVLLRARRVVIAGDPKQLPPTRFFEQALAESDDVAAETAEEVFTQQQSEAEDLLAAALNLSVQEAFLDVHYRSQDEALIGFSNEAFYGGRLQPIPGHPRHKAFQAPIRLIHVDGVYLERGNVLEAKAAANLVAELLDDAKPPSIGLACFNVNQRDLILDALDEKAAADSVFSDRLAQARERRGADSFEGLFVKNIENVQGDERDHIIICTTFGPDPEGRFRRNFGALSRSGGERRLNVLVTRARTMIHVLTSIPRAEYLATEPLDEGQRLTGRHQLYAYLRYTESLAQAFDSWQQRIEGAKSSDAPAECQVAETSQKSSVAEALGRHLCDQHQVGSTVYWGNEGFCVDLALTHPTLPFDVTVGLLADFTRYLKTPDPIIWEQFRSRILASQGWELHRVWSPALFRDAAGQIDLVCERHEAAAKS